VFLAIATSTLFYTLVYLVLRGTISMSNGLRLNFNTEDRKRSLDMDGSDPKYQQFILTVARSLLWRVFQCKDWLHWLTDACDSGTL